MQVMTMDDGRQFVVVEGNVMFLTDDATTSAAAPVPAKAAKTVAKAKKIEIPQYAFKSGTANVLLSQVYQSKTGKAYRDPRVRIETRVSGREGTAGMSPAITMDTLREIRNMPEDTFVALTTDARA